MTALKTQKPFGWGTQHVTHTWNNKMHSCYFGEIQTMTNKSSILRGVMDKTFQLTRMFPFNSLPQLIPRSVSTKYASHTVEWQPADLLWTACAVWARQSRTRSGWGSVGETRLRRTGERLGLRRLEGERPQEIKNRQWSTQAIGQCVWHENGSQVICYIAFKTIVFDCVLI